MMNEFWCHDQFISYKVQALYLFLPELPPKGIKLITRGLRVIAYVHKQAPINWVSFWGQVNI